MATGIVEILKYARTGIRDWHTKKDKNLTVLLRKMLFYGINVNSNIRLKN
jgi:hypothetical protein